MSNLEDFKIKVDNVPATDRSGQQLDEYDKVAAKKGYISRAPQGKILRKRQIHAWVQNRFGDFLYSEAKKRRVQQGVILEEALELYHKKHYDDTDQRITE